MKIFFVVTIILATFCVVNAEPQSYNTPTPANNTPILANNTSTPANNTSTPSNNTSTPANNTSTPAAPAAPAAAPATSSPVLPGYPAVNKVPDTNDPQVQAWLKELDMSQVPSLPLSNGGVPNPSQAQCGPPTVVQPDQGSWTCQKFTAEDDIQSCPDVGTWGLTYDDGPTDATPALLSKLDEHKLKATFFVVGSRVITSPNTLKAAFDAGHNIAVHTWSHPALTSLSNEAVVAELKWTIKAIKDVIGVTPLYMRPPYGDTDNRVRAIARACGLKTVLWVPEFDSNDWTLNLDPPKSIDSVVNTYETWMQQFPKMNTGFIVLEHDLTPRTVEAASAILDRAVDVPNLKIMTVPECVGDKKPYLELKAENSTSNSNNNSTSNSNNAKTSSSTTTVSFTIGTIITVLFSSLLNLC